jgi:hypothetical protein
VGDQDAEVVDAAAGGSATDIAFANGGLEANGEEDDLPRRVREGDLGASSGL